METTQIFLVIISSAILTTWIIGGVWIAYKKDVDIDFMFGFGVASVPLVIAWGYFVLRITGL